MHAGIQGTASYPSYFLIAISTRENLDLCIRYGLAGFPGGEGGAWTFCEVREGDYVSFLYGARAHNLYKVLAPEALRDAERLPPSWKPVGRKSEYYFPFRLHLEPTRTFSESIVRSEFSYVAENLLLRGGYRKSHFQADQTTLQTVSQMGEPTNGSPAPLQMPAHDTFTLRFTRTRALVKTPETCRFKEPILQSAIRQHLMRTDNLRAFLRVLNLPDDRANGLEILGEKALMQGHIDLLLKERVPLGSNWKVPIEVKTKKAALKDLAQLRGYMDELREDSEVGVLVAADFAKQVVARAPDLQIKLVRYTLNSDLSETPTFGEILQGLRLGPATT